MYVAAIGPDLFKFVFSHHMSYKLMFNAPLGFNN